MVTPTGSSSQFPYLLVGGLVFVLGVVSGTLLQYSMFRVGSPSITIQDLSLVLVSIIGPFLAVKYATTFTRRERLEEIYYLRCFETSDEISRHIEALSVAIVNATALTATQADLSEIHKLAIDVETSSGSLFLSPEDRSKIQNVTHVMIEKVAKCLDHQLSIPTDELGELRTLVASLMALRDELFGKLFEEFSSRKLTNEL